MLKAVVFDLDDTLYDYSGLDREAAGCLCEFAGKRLGVTREAFAAAYEGAKRATKAALGQTGASHNRLLYCQKALELLKEKPALLALELYEAYWGYMLAHMSLREGAEELLRYCYEEGLKIGICTDLTAHIQHRKLHRLGLARWTDVLVTSEEAGAEKPSPLIYGLLLRKLDLKPGQVLFVGDSWERDVAGPRSMGMHAFWFRDAGTGRPYAAVPVGKIKELISAI